jgi:cysteine desulfurase/selenocysteine lyase
MTMAVSKTVSAINNLQLTSADVLRLRQDFPILRETVRGMPLTYLDNAATTQKPRQVIDTVQNYYEKVNANIHRGVYDLSERATLLFEESREKVRRYINAASTQEIIFVRGTTEAINLVAQSYGRPFLKPGDEIIISTMEHHSNIVPWQMVCEQTGAVLRIIKINDAGELLLEDYYKLLNSRTRLVAVVHISNSIGTINPIQEIISAAHQYKIPVLIDGAQAAAHTPLDMQELDCDFYTLSGHKVFAPTGIGVLYGKAGLLNAMPPYQGGGDMISQVTFAKTTYKPLPYKFEAGTPHIAGVIGLGAALDYVNAIGLNAIASYEHELLLYATEQLQQIPGLHIIGNAAQKASIISFIMDGIHPHDIGTILDEQGVAIRAGHHCTMPLMERMGVAATARASFCFYNTRADIDRLIAAVQKVKEVFR